MSWFLSSSARLEIEACTRSQRADHGVARRANAILLLDDRKSCQVIAECLYLDDDTIRGWYNLYRIGGWDTLAIDGWKVASPLWRQHRKVHYALVWKGASAVRRLR